MKISCVFSKEYMHIFLLINQYRHKTFSMLSQHHSANTVHRAIVMFEDLGLVEKTKVGREKNIVYTIRGAKAWKLLIQANELLEGREIEYIKKEEKKNVSKHK